MCCRKGRPTDTTEGLSSVCHRPIEPLLPHFLQRMSTNENILEPPGTIAILGSGPLTIELALYARYLGFSVTVLAAEEIGAPLGRLPDAKPPSLFATPLGLAALAAQRGLGGTMVDLDVTNHRQWIENYYVPLIEADLLRGRFNQQAQIQSISFAPPDAKVQDRETDQTDPLNEAGEVVNEDEDEDLLPPDFLITWVDADGQHHQDRFEAIIDARPGDQAGISAWPELAPQPKHPANTDDLPDFYLTLPDLTSNTPTDSEMAAAFERIRQTFAQLCDRETLDVYRNLGGFP